MILRMTSMMDQIHRVVQLIRACMKIQLLGEVIINQRHKKVFIIRNGQTTNHQTGLIHIMDMIPDLNISFLEEMHLLGPELIWPGST